jgi:hypothetical protein
MDVTMKGGTRTNFQFIVTLSVLIIVVLLAVAVILVGYGAATQHAVGQFAPFGDAINVKKKTPSTLP